MFFVFSFVFHGRFKKLVNGNDVIGYDVEQKWSSFFVVLATSNPDLIENCQNKYISWPRR